MGLTKKKNKTNSIKIRGAKMHNLKNIDFEFNELDINEVDTNGNSLSIDLVWIGKKNAKKLYLKKIMDALFVEQKIGVKIAMVKSLFLNINQRNEMKIEQLQMKFIIMLSV